MKSALRWRPFAAGIPKPAAKLKRMVSTRSPFLRISEEVQEAIQSRKPVVALETTIYTHGFPYPENIALSSHLESVVRLNGGIPATIGVLNGVAKIGFQPEELIELLESAGKESTIKLSRRDLGYICGLGLRGRRMNGGTTIAGTMILAHLAGIKVFATGGLGGVHRGGENSMDISADLTELGRTPVALVSSGCKSFLDIPRTLEYLETQGVGVGTFSDGRDGRVDFPAFWTRDSGLPSPTAIQDEAEAAAIIHAQMTLPLSSGLLFANPIPTEHSLSKERMDEVMAQAIHDATERGISGSDNTPFVLARIRELTGGSTITANKILVEENVKRGTKVAVELAKLDLRDRILLAEDRRNGRDGTTLPSLNGRKVTSQRAPFISQQGNRRDCNVLSGQISRRSDVIVAGSLAIDLCCDYLPTSSRTTPLPETSNPATITQRLGGVGQNVATAIHYLESSVCLSTAVGDDAAGHNAITALSQRGMRVDGVRVLEDGSRTAQYVAVNDAKKGLVMAMADMTILEGTVSEFRKLWQPILERHKPKWLVVDGNWDAATLSRWIEAARDVGAKIAFEPVSVEKSIRIFGHQIQKYNMAYRLADLASPNALELEAMFNFVQARGFDCKSLWSMYVESIPLTKLSSLPAMPSNRHIAIQALMLLPYIPCILTKLGPEGVLLTQFLPPGHPRLRSQAAQKHIIFSKANGDDDFKTILRSGLGHLHSPDETASRHFDKYDHTLSNVAGVYLRLFPPAEVVPEEEIISVNGVGDTFLGIVVAGLAKDNPKPIEELVQIAQRGAVMTLKSKESVSEKIATLKSQL